MKLVLIFIVYFLSHNVQAQTKNAGPVEREIIAKYSKTTQDIVSDISSKFDDIGIVGSTNKKISEILECKYQVGEKTNFILVTTDLGLGQLWGPVLEISCNLPALQYDYSWIRTKSDGTKVNAIVKIANVSIDPVYGHPLWHNSWLLPENLDFESTPCNVTYTSWKIMTIDYIEKSLESGTIIYQRHHRFPEHDKPINDEDLKFPNCGEFKDKFKFEPIFK